MTKSTKRKLERRLSNLELTVLGLAWLRGPCSIYALMKELSLSASSFHKNRAGTTYSVANRLLEFGLLESVSEHRTEDQQVRISEAGLNHLRRWYDAPVPMEDVAHSADLIRLRFFFLGVVDSAERLSFVESAETGLQEFLSQCRSLMVENERIGDYFGVLATLSTIFETEARLRWLRVVKEFVSEPLEDRSQWVQRVLQASIHGET